MGKIKILILGARGNLGTQLMKAFKKGYATAGWDREDLDMADAKNLARRIREAKPDIIINTVAYNAVDNCEEADGFKQAEILNGRLVEQLARITRDLGAIFVQYSSDYVFAGDRRDGYRESDAPAPLNKYGETKLMSEQAMSSQGAQGLKYYLIRTSKLFGPKGKSKGAKPSFFDLMLDLSEKKQELNVVNEETSCFTYTPDLAGATRGLLEGGQAWGIYHIVNPGPATWYEAAMALFKMTGTNIKVNAVSSESYPRPAKRPNYSVLLNTKLPPLRDYREALREYFSLKIK